MFRTAFGFAVILAAASGCTMCSHPYDYSGPVYDNDGGCMSGFSRAGSILDGAYDESFSPSQSTYEAPAPAPAAVQTTRKSRPSKPAQETAQREAFSYAMKDPAVTKQLLGDAQEGDVPGSERIISITERVVDSSSDMQSDAALAASQAEPSRPLPTSGWTARRPGSNSFR